MAYIWIFGDSWGDTWGTYGGPEIAPDIGFEHQFEKQGHKIRCLAVAGTSNRNSLQIAQQVLDKGAKPPTHVIQFWTEPLRDFHYCKEKNLFDVNRKWKFYDLNNSITEYLINKTKKVKQKMGNPHWAIIGGQSSLKIGHSDRIGATFVINHWRNTIMNKNLPDCFLLGSLQLLQDAKNKDDIQTKQGIVNIATEILDSMAKSNHFLDNAHPDWHSYKKLSQKLLDWIDKT